MSSKPKIKLSPYIKNEKGEFVEPPRQNKEANNDTIRISITGGQGRQSDVQRRRTLDSTNDIIKIALTDVEKEMLDKLKRDGKV